MAKYPPAPRAKASGGASLVSEGTAALMDRIRHGYPWPLAHRYQERLDFADPAFAAFLGMSPRTLARRRRGAAPLDAVASDRLYRLMRAVELAAEALEDEEAALSWLRRPQPGLGGCVPLETLDTQPGFDAVQALLARIDYGVIA